ncbi:hypothetical protein LL912_22150 [Niabella sp. CC-SYL272]|uniref:hypothetical protein n=1 Tax=Niabella agricola TaxID=2891571 RepID=UPI001F416783|nr:hypothetical protein [Niabella agricola]MCF3111505.1 hypothetical protein [Niabella agricola]
MDVSEMVATETEGIFEMMLNRDGIYDKLPEGLFHQTKGNSRVRTVQDAVDEHKRFREEERQARSFFAPLEQLLFRYQVFVEAEEREALFTLQSGRRDPAWFRFWNFNESLPEEEAGRMLQLMPYLHFIKGDAASTEAALGHILSKKVVLRQEERRNTVAMQHPAILTETHMGMDSVLGHNTLEFFPCWIFTIEGTSNEEMQPFVKQPNKMTILQKFEDLFIPFEMDVQFEFEIREEAAGKDLGAVLGYGAHI